jgi:hypothetical protein
VGRQGTQSHSYLIKIITLWMTRMIKGEQDADNMDLIVSVTRALEEALSDAPIQSFASILRALIPVCLCTTPLSLSVPSCSYSSCSWFSSAQLQLGC